jgi:hypothetical protein
VFSAPFAHKYYDQYATLHTTVIIIIIIIISQSIYLQFTSCVQTIRRRRHLPGPPLVRRIYLSALCAHKSHDRSAIHYFPTDHAPATPSPWAAPSAAQPPPFVFQNVFSGQIGPLFFCKSRTLLCLLVVRLCLLRRSCFKTCFQGRLDLSFSVSHAQMRLRVPCIAFNLLCIKHVSPFSVPRSHYMFNDS